MKSLIIFTLIAMALSEETAKKQLTDGNNQFSAKFLNEVAKQNVGKSVVTSGFSALSPLAVLGLGSVGPSHDEILKAIGWPDDETTKTAFSSLNGQLKSLEKVQLKVANRIYVAEGRALNDSFAQMSSNVFGLDVQNLDFAHNVEAAAKVNKWVEDNTNNRIKDLVEASDFNSDTRAVFLNAIYFKAKWENTFVRDYTEDRDFHVSKDKTIKVPTMYKNGYVKFGQSEDLKAKLLELPYEGGKTSMLFVVPDEVEGLAALQNKLVDLSKLESAVNQMKNSQAFVYLPKFKVETTIDVKVVLKNAFGVEKLFKSNEAKLDYVLKSGNDLFIDGAKQKAFLEVNEEGTEAAAATVIGGVGSAAPGSDVKEFVADRPFYFELKSGDLTLFSGVYHG